MVLFATAPVALIVLVATVVQPKQMAGSPKHMTRIKVFMVYGNATY